MAHRKKKPSGHQLQAIANAHYKNEFLSKIKSFVNSCCGEDIYALLPPKIIERIYRLRFHSLSFVSAADNMVPNIALKSQKQVISDWLKNFTFDLPKYGIKVSLNDYLTVGLTVFSMYHIIHDNDFASAPKVRTALRNYCDDDEHYNRLNDELFLIFLTIGSSICNLEIGFYWLNFEPKLAEKGKTGINNLVEIHLQMPESFRIKINGTVRPAIRLGWALPFTGLDWIMMKPSSLGIRDALSDDPMKVFIQSHALLRLTERIDSIETSVAQYNMYDSFLNANVFYDSNHNLLIEYRIFGTKAGYFRVDVVDGIVAVRTFLFLTQSGTPEGVLLWKNTGLKMLDKKYLAIDKLSTFISSDINKNEQINKIFSDAGCQSLLELYDKIDQICTKHSSQSTCSLMLDYLGCANTPISEAILE